ncbi:hypothetical protein C6Y14_17165 [Streptomyces dioscori]|uniref:Uncharacterized protein n=1 Tax=Streptomyces dioscori TaxID=2109333 RepID=A0A2P8Q7D1_9ACTN|nr:hypothetical protein [Streptomyces dioscori]PSM42143.1 hypothetical protein C6Y14_17165 [Streptomyces dioscori]
MGPHIRNTRYVPQVRHCRTALVAALASARFTPVPAVSATAATPRFPSGTAGTAGTFDGSWPADATSHRFLPDDPDDPDDPTCHAPRLAARLSHDIRAALSSRRGTVSVAVRDDLGLVCELAGERQYDSAGIAKVLVMEGLLRRAEQLGRSLTRACGLGLLAEVRADRRGGVPAGKGHPYPARPVVVLTHDNPTKAYGVRTIERIAQVVHRGLGQGGGPGRAVVPETPGTSGTLGAPEIPETAEALLSEEPDGSAPYEPLPGRDEPEPGATP